MTDQPSNSLIRFGQSAHPAEVYEQNHLIARAIKVAQEQTGIVDTKEALAAVCHDWLQLHGVSPVRPNPFRMAQLIAEELEAEDIEPEAEEEEPEEMTFWQRVLSWL